MEILPFAILSPLIQMLRTSCVG